MKAMKKYLPLSDPETIYEASGESVVPHIVLPVGVDTERIVLNVPRLKRLARMAGTNELHLVTADESMFDKVNYDVEAQEGGTALLTGLPSLPKKDYTRYSYDDRDHPLRLGALGGGWPEDKWRERIDQMYKTGQLAVYLNRRAIQDDISAGGKSIVDAQAWGKGINRAIKRGITEAAVGRYAPESGEWTRFSLNVMPKAIAVSDLMIGNYYFPAVYGILGTLRRTMQLRLVTSGQQPASAYNWSAFGIHRVDRLAATAVLARSATLVKTRA